MRPNSGGVCRGGGGGGVEGGIYYYRGSSPWQMGFHLFNLCWSIPVKRINKPSVFLRPPQSQRLNYLKANWVLKWAICQWEAHWFNLPCGFTPDATGAPLCAYRKRGDRYTYPSLNSSSKRVVMGCLCARSCCHVPTRTPLLFLAAYVLPLHLIFFCGIQVKRSDGVRERGVKGNQYLGLNLTRRMSDCQWRGHLCSPVAS